MFKTKAVAMALAVAGSFSASPAFAGDLGRDRMERGQDRRELRQDARQVRDDRRDLARLEATLADLDRARAARRAGMLGQVDRNVMELLHQEWEETQRELAQKSREAQRSQAEVRHEGREVRRDMMRGGPAYGDRRDLRDDRRDARDDRRDLGKEAFQASRRHQIAVAYHALTTRMDPPSLDQRRALLVELIGLARAELRDGRREVREDRREIREDRRETREDRRDGRRY